MLNDHVHACARFSKRSLPPPLVLVMAMEMQPHEPATSVKRVDILKVAGFERRYIIAEHVHVAIAYYFYFGKQSRSGTWDSQICTGLLV